MTPATERQPASPSYRDRSELSENEAAIRERVDSLAEAIRNKNLDQVLWHYAPDVVVFDLLPPLDVRGIGKYRQNFEKWFATMAGRIHYEMLDVTISADNTHAFVHCLSHVTGARTGGGRADYWVRVTSGWRKTEGQWLIAHEHISMPTMM